MDVVSVILVVAIILTAAVMIITCRRMERHFWTREVEDPDEEWIRWRDVRVDDHNNKKGGS